MTFIGFQGIGWAAGNSDCAAGACPDDAQVIIIREGREEASPGEQYAVPHQNPLATSDPTASPRVRTSPGATLHLRRRRPQALHGSPPCSYATARDRVSSCA